MKQKLLVALAAALAFSGGVVSATAVGGIQMDGFRGVAALAQRDSGKSLVVTFWDSEDALTASEERASQMRSKAVDETGATSAPQVDRYEVIFYRAREK